MEIPDGLKAKVLRRLPDFEASGGDTLLLDDIIEEACEDTLSETNQTEISSSMESIVIDIAVIKYNRVGTEGLASDSQGGVSNSYLNEYPESLKRKIAKHRKMKGL
ncbi:phage head-tail connector protein [Listeria seeligeri]|uniref:phage head-tail connector protein n=1 Tax=Listeria seeligeri TaxID=1640 RepID=UPI0001C4EC52|nr:phage head-tail connector protein [Listeria seeligeri]CBH27758.1 phage-related protein, putative [Listeria seeligeri serovar 1/2b str. SLCC3954]